jgi:hypothetical protein
MDTVQAKENVRVICRHCSVRYASKNEERVVFHLDVPVKCDRESLNLHALLRVELAPNKHRIELIAAQDENAQPLFIEDDAMLDSLVERISRIGSERLCGDTGICPAEVAEAVKNFAVK